MAVSNRLLGVLAAVAFGLIAWPLTDLTRFRPHVSRSFTAAELARIALSDSATRLGLLVHTKAVLDRVDSAIARSGGGGVPEVVLVGASGRVVTVAESLYALIPKPAGARIPMRLALVDSSSGSSLRRGALHSFAVLPDTAAGGSCTTVRVVGATDTRWDLDSWAWVPWRGSVGPCWFLARFGTPGPAVRAWLDSRYWDVAGAIPPVLRPRADSADGPSGPGLLYRLFGDIEWVFYNGSVVLEGCADRRPDLCEALFLDTPYPAGLLPASVVGNDRVGNLRVGNLAQARRGGWMFELPRSETQVLLAAMVDDLGPAQFAEFWTSNAPVAEAFEAAAGRSLGDWYRLKLRREWRDAGLPDPRQHPNWPSAFGFLALALGGTLWFGGRRQVR